MRLGQTLKTASFKLTAAYAGLFALSVGVLAAVTYFSVTGQLSRDFHSRIRVESKALESDLASGGTRQLLHDISERQRGQLQGGLDYTLFAEDGRRLFGNLPTIPCVRGWTVLSGPPDGDEPPGEMEKVGVYVTPLSNGFCLLVGSDWGLVQNFGAVILKAFGWISLLSLTMAVGGGLFLSAEFLKRIESINRTAEAIIGGDIQRRIPRRAAPDDLDRLAATLNRMLDRMSGLMDSLKQLSNNIAHDLRTPLGRLRQLLDSARLQPLSGPQYQNLVDRSVEEIDSILELFGAVLRISQIESGSRRSGFSRFCLSRLVEEICETFTPVFEEDGKSLTADITPELWIMGDQELLTLSLANLLENANVHTPDKTRIAVSVRKAGASVELCVADNGGGVPEADRNRIFQRFYRLESSRTTAGNGLGLSIVAAVADLHTAEISASDNKPGLRIGMTFPSAA